VLAKASGHAVPRFTRLAAVSVAFAGLLLSANVPSQAWAGRPAQAKAPAAARVKAVKAAKAAKARVKSRVTAGKGSKAQKALAARKANRTLGRTKVVVRKATGTATTRAPKNKIKIKVVGPMGNPIAHLPPVTGKGKRIVFGVMGGAGSNTPAKVNGLLHAMGGHIAKSGNVVLTGAAPGLPDHSVRGAREAGGLTVGISSFRTMAAHREAGAPTNFDVLQMTSLPPSLKGQNRPNFMGREIDNIERSDVIVIAGGRFGTLGELAIALEERRPVGVLTGSGGVADIVKDVVKASTRAGKAPGAPVIYDSNPKRLVSRLIKAKQQLDMSGKKGPLGDGDGPFKAPKPMTKPAGP